MLKNLIILPDGTEIVSGNARDNSIISCKYTQCVNDSTELSIGSCCCNELEIKLFAKDGLSIAANDEIQYYKVDDSGARTKMGVFRCEKPTVTGTGTYKFVAYDNVSKLDKDLTEWLSGLTGWSYTVATFAGMVCAQCGVTLSLSEALPNQDYQIREFSGSGVTGRMIMQWLGQITCRFIRANVHGEIEFAWYTDKEMEISTSGDFTYFGGGLSYEDYKVAQIQKVQIQVTDEDNGTVYPDSSEEELNTYKITGNYLLTAETGEELKPVAKAIYEQLQSVTYTPCNVSIRATTQINAGDIVRVTDRNGVTITMYVMLKTNNGQKDTLECTGSYARDSSTATNEVTLKALNGKVLEVSKSVDGLRIANKDTTGRLSELEMDVEGIGTAVQDAQGNITQLQQNAGQVSVIVQDEEGGTLATYINKTQWAATYKDKDGNEISGLTFDAANKRFILNAAGQFGGVGDDDSFIQVNGSTMSLFTGKGEEILQIGYENKSTMLPSWYGNGDFSYIRFVTSLFGAPYVSQIMRFLNGLWIGNDDVDALSTGAFSPTANSSGIFIDNVSSKVTVYNGEDGQDIYTGEAIAKFG